ncbi:UNVERIFIED_CONTAM: hypothetical protein GTU68_004917 [Idotea baltica]|nr:hypothetical protein [Idotea baltica]
MALNSVLAKVTDRIVKRSEKTRNTYLERMENMRKDGPQRAHLSCGNQAHAYAPMGDDKAALAEGTNGNLGIITAYNDMLSAHQPFQFYPDIIKETARAAGGTAQVAAGVPAMCDGITQGQTGMELSLFSRDAIAMSTGIGLSHNVFDSTATIMGKGLEEYTKDPKLIDDELIWTDGVKTSLNDKIVASAAKPFQATGGLSDLKGNLGSGVMKVSAVAEERRQITAPVRVFHDQHSVLAAFRNDEFTSDLIVVVRYQGPKANGMPELHGLTPCLTVLQDRGIKVALVSDGRMSGASGKVPAAIHVSPEALDNGPLAFLQDGDIVTVDAINGTLDAQDASIFNREITHPDMSDNKFGLGRELFDIFRNNVGPAQSGATIFNF